MNMNEECLLKYLQNPDELFDLNNMLSEFDEVNTDTTDINAISDYMLQHIY